MKKHIVIILLSIIIMAILKSVNVILCGVFSLLFLIYILCLLLKNNKIDILEDIFDNNNE